MAVVKANAYGHGMLTVAQHLSGADSFAVARLPEALALREAGIDQPVVLLAGVVTEDGRRKAFEHGFELVVHDVSQLDVLRKARGPAGKVWLKIDTGMNRLGFPPAAAAELIRELQDNDSISELRLMTHLASADEPENPDTARQLAAFEAVARGFQGSVSVANSPA